ncbi:MULTISPECIES: chaplin [unclassified Streptomyces]|uniref:Chaplin n=1 Tax=Streptomyces sp. NBC_00060 TaxID=2975636 RepID=A0AAU2GSJ0_9ACTN
MRVRLMAAACLAAATVLTTASTATADEEPLGTASDAPSVLSGSTSEEPVDLDLNVCGNSINVIGVLNPALGNKCEDD